MRVARLSLREIERDCLTVTHAHATKSSERVLQVVRSSEPARLWRRDSALLARQGFWAGEPCVGERPTEVLVLWERTRLEDADRAPRGEVPVSRNPRD